MLCKLFFLLLFFIFESVNLKKMGQLLNDEFNRISSIPKNSTRHKRLVKWNSIKCNTKVHTIQNK